jgi:hypothetical protein
MNLINQILVIALSSIGIICEILIRDKNNHSHHIKHEISKILGIKLQHLSLIYFGIILLSSLALTFANTQNQEIIIFESLILTTTATIFGFSVILIDAFIHKIFHFKFALLSLLSLAISIVIPFEISVDLISIFTKYRPILVMGHLLGFALGLGGAVFSDILLMKFLKDFRISKKESDIISTLSEIIWIGTTILFISGIGIFLTDIETYSSSSKFIAKVIIFTVLVINGIALHMYMLPKMSHISFHHDDSKIPYLSALRRRAFLMGAISITSWFATFILGSVKSVPLSVIEIIGVYLGLITIAATGGILAEKHMVQKAKKHQQK